MGQSVPMHILIAIRGLLFGATYEDKALCFETKHEPRWTIFKAERYSIPRAMSDANLHCWILVISNSGLVFSDGLFLIRKSFKFP